MLCRKDPEIEQWTNLDYVGSTTVPEGFCGIVVDLLDPQRCMLEEANEKLSLPSVLVEER